MAKKFIVIGAGILGATTAYQLAKSGADVTIVDRQDKGQATDAAAGIVCPWLSQRRNKAWYRLAKGGARIYPGIIASLADDGETDTGYARVGTVRLHTEEKKMTAMRDRAIKRREDAPEIGDISLLDSQQTRKLFPPLSDAYGAVHVSGGARVDGRKMRDALLRGAKKHGAEFIAGEAELLREGNRITGVVAGNETRKADAVIAACGVWMNKLCAPLGVKFLVTPQKAQIMHLELPEKQTANWPVVMPPDNSYMLAFEHGRIVVGSTHENDAGLDGRVTAGGVKEILTKGLGVAPGLADSAVLETRVGFRPFTPGFLPVIGLLPGYEGLLVANGLGASGLTMGPYIGTQLARLALGESLEIGLADYDVGGAVEMGEGF
ncbi:NAD(P)/FAD-dependent oxidoreductase [Lentibacillus sediminis]|uniref:NAD(P)/FAD-dependent oxidoreductase n=1 Tax=Lentibacillus sediminis TaxID=1940529 RepID=UPI000C1BDC97|nr:FAD-dependent oxidoreductase [Lentibacillus sediminis]